MSIVNNHRRKAARSLWVHSESAPGAPWQLLLALLLTLVSTLALGMAPAGAQTPELPPTARLRVATASVEPFVIVEEDGSLSGFTVDLWQAVAEHLGRDYDWIHVDTVEEQLQAVVDGRADVALGAISITAERELLVDFSHPYFAAGLRILTRSQAEGSTLRSLITTLFSPALLQIVAASLLVLLFMAHIIWLVEREHDPEIPRGYLRGVWEAFWRGFFTIAKHHYGEGEKPPTVLRRLMVMFWVALGFVLIAQFTAAVTATLTVQRLSAEIHGVEDLSGKRIATEASSTAAHYLDDRNLGYISVSRIEEAYSLVLQGEADAIVFDSPVLVYFANSAAGQGQVEVTGPILTDEAYGMALPVGSPWRKQINAAILRLQQDGTYEDLYNEWFGSQR